MLVYCDSVILIYFFDHTGYFNVRATNPHFSQGGMRLATDWRPAAAGRRTTA